MSDLARIIPARRGHDAIADGQALARHEARLRGLAEPDREVHALFDETEDDVAELQLQLQDSMRLQEAAQPRDEPVGSEGHRSGHPKLA